MGETVISQSCKISQKRQDTDAYRYFLSEMILYKGFTDETELGSNDEDKCKQLYIQNEVAIQEVKRILLPYAQGVEESRHFAEEALQENEGEKSNIGNILDPEQEKENDESQDFEEIHEDLIHMNPDAL